MSGSGEQKISAVRVGVMAAFLGGAITAGIGLCLGGMFGIFAFGDYPVPAAIGGFGLGLAFLWFPLFIPVSALLAVPAVWLILKHKKAVKLKTFVASFAVAFLLLAGVSAAFTTFGLLRLNAISKESRKERNYKKIENSVFKVRDLVIEQRGAIITVRPVMEGTLAGRYRMTLFIENGGYPPLITEAKEADLPSGSQGLSFDVPLSSIQADFRKTRMVPGSTEEVLVGPLNCIVTLKLALLSTSAANLESVMPSHSDTCASTANKSIRLDLGRF